MVFVLFTLCITWWAARRTHSTADFIAPVAVSGAGRTAWRWPATTCPPPRCWESPRSSTAPGWMANLSHRLLRGWPVLLLLMTERLRNLGRFTFADITSVPSRPGGAHHGRHRLADRGVFLPGGADGRGRAVDQAAVRPGLPDRPGDRRCADDAVCDFRRYGGNHPGADRQGIPAAGRRLAGAVPGDARIRLQL